jgi:hypothetical protein
MLFSFVSNSIIETIYNTIKETIFNIITPPQAGNEMKNKIKENKINLLLSLTEEGKANELEQPLISDE